MKPIPHLLYVGKFDGLLDIFTICNIMEASNILHYKTYRRGTEGLTAADRRRMIHGRITARQILTWIFSNYAFEGDVSMEVFYWRYLAHQLKTLCQIKERVEWQDINTFDCNSIAKEVKKKIQQTFAGVGAFQKAWEDLPEDEVLEGEVPEVGDSDNEDEVPVTKPRYARKLQWSLNERYKVVVRCGEPSNKIDFSKHHFA